MQQSFKQHVVALKLLKKRLQRVTTNTGLLNTFDDCQLVLYHYLDPIDCQSQQTRASLCSLQPHYSIESEWYHNFSHLSTRCCVCAYNNIRGLAATRFERHRIRILFSKIFFFFSNPLRSLRFCASVDLQNENENFCIFG